RCCASHRCPHSFPTRRSSDLAAVAWYQRAARDAIDGVFARGADAVLVGGSGLYVSSVVFDFRFPPHDDQLRAELEDELQRLGTRSEEHTSELQSRENLVCRLL